MKYPILLTYLLILLTYLLIKINEGKNEIPSITNLAITTTAFTAVENKIPDHSKYMTTPEFDKLTVEKRQILMIN